MNIQNLYWDAAEIYTNVISATTSTGDIVRGAVLRTAIRCYSTYLSGEEQIAFGKNNILATHRLFCNPLDIDSTDLVVIDGTWYGIKHIDTCNSNSKSHNILGSIHYEILLLAIKAPQNISVTPLCQSIIDSWDGTILNS